MRVRYLFLAALASLFFLTLNAGAQTTAAIETSNNTSACAAAGSPSYCQAGFTAMNDPTTGQTYNPVPGHVSNVNIHSLIYGGSSYTKFFVYVEPWFCMVSGSTVTGTGTLCGNHIQVGYNSADPAAIHAQVNDMISRGIDGLDIDDYGPNNFDNVVKGFAADLAARCSSAPCKTFFSLMEDDGSFKWISCPYDGGGVDQTQCLINALNSDLNYMDQNFFGNVAYLKVDPVTKQPSATGRPVIQFFICEECYTDPPPNWNYVWSQVRANAQHFNNGNGLFIFRNGGAFTHTETDGGYAWPGWWGLNMSDDPYGEVYLSNFYSTASQYPNLLTFGGGWKGFNDSAASWHPNPYRVMGQQCGNTFLQTIREVTQNSYWASTKLPFLGVATWNDYEEGTEVETGIDNCLTLKASLSGSTLSWTLTFSDSSGSEKTVNHYEILYGKTSTLYKLTSIPAGKHSINLANYSIAKGTYNVYVKAVGQPMILNKLSNDVIYKR